MIEAASLGAALLRGDDPDVRMFVGHAARIDAFGIDRVGADAVLTARPRLDVGTIQTKASLTSSRFACAVLQTDASSCAVFTRSVGDVLERAWLVSHSSRAPSPFLGLATPHDPRMSQHPPQVDVDPTLHAYFSIAHGDALRRDLRAALAPHWQAARTQIAVCEAFSDGAAWAALLRVQGEVTADKDGVVQVGAWAVAVSDGALMTCVVDAWEPAARLIAVRADRL